RLATTGPDGRWSVSDLPSGSYRLRFVATGFQTANSVISYDAANPVGYQTALDVGITAQSGVVTATAPTVDTETAQTSGKKDKHAKNPPAPPPPPSTNVYSLQQRVAGVLPVAVDIPRTGTSYRFLRPLVLNEETRLSFAYKSK